MKNQRKLTSQLLNSIQSFEGQTLPVCRIFAVDIADTSCQEVYAQISDSLALVGICAFAHTYNAVFFAADCTNLSFDGNALFMSSLNQLSGLFNVLVDRVMRAIEHDGREASFQTLVAAVV